MKNSYIKKLVIVCRDYNLIWEQFINPIFIGVETGVLSWLKYKKSIKFICGDNDTINKQQLKILNDQSKIHNFEIITFNKKNILLIVNLR
ncbi:hypothetical protein [Spiroplasma ixodetis]|uniref:Uncharacterized protein n=1 Tax=Spiroplasma ixodetis TaxID=2141 RepID=A0ABM8JMU7_9MOLU